MVLRSILRRAALAIAFLAGAPALVGAGSLLVATTANAAVLNQVQVRGNVRIDSATIRSYVTVPVGRNYSQSDLNDTLVTLFVTGLFADVDVTGTDGTILIVVVENPVVAQVAFIGNRKVDNGDLEAIVQTVSRGVVSAAGIAGDKARIEDRYASVGRAVVVTVEIQNLPGNTANVVFTMDEGDRLKVSSIEFVGNSAFSNRQLHAVIETRESNLLSWLSKNDTHGADALARDGELLRQHYLNNGFADFQVVATEVVFDAARSSDTITYTLSEGPQYRFGPVRIDSSLGDVTAAMLSRHLHIAEGRVFSAGDLERTMEDITVALAGAGHPFARVVPRANRDYAAGTIEITFLVDDGAPLYVERITITGNTRTRDYVIRREFPFAERDAYNRVLVDLVERRLRNLGLFDGVAISEHRGSAPDQVVLVVEVAERRTGQISATGGYSTVDGILGEISLTEDNFLGRGQTLRLAFTIGRNNRNYSISFTEPYFLGRRLPVGFDLYNRTSNAGAARPFDEATIGAQVRLGLPLTESMSLQLSYRFVNQVISASTAAIYPNGTTVTSSLTYGYTFSTVDNPGDPQRGLFLRASQEFAGLGGNNSFLKTTIDARYYRPLGHSSPIGVAFRAQAGNIMGIGQSVRPIDHFFLGGETIRGFASTGFGPRTADAAALAVGGKTYWAVTAELRFPIPFLPEDLGFRAALFADAGMLTGVDAPLPGGTPFFSDTTIRTSIGASLLWASPVGLLRVDFAKALTKAPYDVTQIVRVGIGGAF